MKTLGNEFSKQSVEQFNLSYKQMKNFYTTKEEKMAEEHLICCVKKRKKLNMSSCCGENEKENKKKTLSNNTEFWKVVPRRVYKYMRRKTFLVCSELFFVIYQMTASSYKSETGDNIQYIFNAENKLGNEQIY